MDFDGLVSLTERLLRTQEKVARTLRGRWDYVLVDEFQDLNAAQYAIIGGLVADHRNLFAVGDEEQSIFSWTGADPGILNRFSEDFGIEKPIVLDHNRRCSIPIFDAARRLISNNPARFAKSIEARRESPFEVEADPFPTSAPRPSGWSATCSTATPAPCPAWENAPCCIAGTATASFSRGYCSARGWPAGWPAARR